MKKKKIIEWLKENWFGLVFGSLMLLMIIVLIKETRMIRIN
jgi:hypothetical protein